MDMSTEISEWELIHPLEILRKARSGLTQKQFLKEIGVYLSTYQRWVNEETIPRFTVEQIDKICRVCRIDPNSLISFLKGEIDIEDLP